MKHLTAVLGKHFTLKYSLVGKTQGRCASSFWKAGWALGKSRQMEEETNLQNNWVSISRALSEVFIPLTFSHLYMLQVSLTSINFVWILCDKQKQSSAQLWSVRFLKSIYKQKSERCSVLLVFSSSTRHPKIKTQGNNFSWNPASW